MSAPLHPTEWPADKLDAVADAAMAEPVAIDWTKPIELDTVPPRPAHVLYHTIAGRAAVVADWGKRPDDCVPDDDLEVNPDGTVIGFEGDFPRVRNVAAMATDPHALGNSALLGILNAAMAADPRDALIAELAHELGNAAVMLEEMGLEARPGGIIQSARALVEKAASK